jgi:hypothetical protein
MAMDRWVSLIDLVGSITHILLKTTILLKTC